MTNNQFEKQIADKLNQYEVQPGDGMLDSIFEKRAIKKKPVGMARLFFAAAIIAVTVSVYLYNENGSNGSNDFIASSSGTAMDNKNPETQAQPAHVKSEGLNQAADKNSQLATVSKPGPDKARHVATSGKRQVTEPGQGNRNIVAVRATENVSPLAKDIGNEHTGRTGNDMFAGDNGDNIANRFFDVSSKNRPNIESMQDKGNSHLYVYHSVKESVLDANTFSSLPFSPLSKFSASYELENENKLANHAPEVKTLSRTSRKPLFIDMLYIPILTSAGANGNPGVQDYANSIRRNSFNAQYGVRVSVPICNRISVFSGLFYQEQSNVYNGTITKPEEVTRVNTIITYINDPVGNVQQVITKETVKIMENKETSYDYKNTYKLFQLPLGLSYNFGYKKIDFAFNTSALINMFSNSKGSSLDMEHNSTNGFASSGKYVGIGAGFSVMSAIKVSPRFKLIFEPGIQRFNINSMKAGNNINEKVFNKQLMIGLRYSLF